MGTTSGCQLQAMKLIKHKFMPRVNHTEQQDMQTAHGENLADLQDASDTVVLLDEVTMRQLHGSISRSPTSHLGSWKLEPRLPELRPLKGIISLINHLWWGRAEVVKISPYIYIYIQVFMYTMTHEVWRLGGLDTLHTEFPLQNVRNYLLVVWKGSSASHQSWQLQKTPHN